MKHTVSMTLGLSLLLSCAAYAHHSFAMFDATRTSSVKGTLHSVEWKNPHSWIWVAVQNDKGGTDVYGFEGGSTGTFSRQGLKKQDLTVGAKVSVDFHPLKDGRTGGQFLKMTFDDGRVVGGFPAPVDGKPPSGFVPPGEFAPPDDDKVTP